MKYIPVFILMCVSAFAGYQFHVWQEKQAIKSFFGANKNTVEQDPRAFWDAGNLISKDQKIIGDQKS